MTYFVYILKCITPSDSKKELPYYYYTGMTKDIHQRLKKHKNEKVTSTKQYNGNLSLVYLEKYNGRTTTDERSWAMRRENQIKDMGQEKKETLIRSPRNNWKIINTIS